MYGNHHDLRYVISFAWIIYDKNDAFMQIHSSARSLGHSNRHWAVSDFFCKTMPVRANSANKSRT